MTLKLGWKSWRESEEFGGLKMSELPAEAIARIIHQVDELIDERVKLVHEIYGKSYLGRDGPTVDADMDPDGELCQLYDLRKKAAEYQVKLSLRKK